MNLSITKLPFFPLSLVAYITGLRIQSNIYKHSTVNPDIIIYINLEVAIETHKLQILDPPQAEGTPNS